MTNNTSEQRVVAVTGTSRGIGASIARELARSGFLVAALTRKGEGIEEDDQGSAPENIHPVICDVSDENSIRSAFVQVAELGLLEGLVNNAGIWVGARSRDLSGEDYDSVMHTNARGCFFACREAYPLLKDHGGTIVNIGSFYDKLGVPGGLAYCASKAAIGAITRCLAVEWARDRIRVVDVAPGFVETDLNASLPEKVRESIRSRIPSGDFGRPDDIGKLVRSIMADGIPFLTGETIYIDGGQGLRE